jgi:hypothetical protein
LALAGPARAQHSTGAIEGVVVDQSGAVLPHVAVRLLPVATGSKRTLSTGGDGTFSALLLPVGVYCLDATFAGFKPLRLSDIRVTVGQTVTLRLEMSIDRIVETAQVSSGTTVLETSRSRASATVD